jgi:hypothetical protein
MSSAKPANGPNAETWHSNASEEPILCCQPISEFDLRRRYLQEALLGRHLPRISAPISFSPPVRS